MKKLYILFLLTALPFIGFGQTTYTFDTDDDGWLAGNDATVGFDSGNYYTSAGSLNLTLAAANKVGKVDFSVPQFGDYTVTFKIKSLDNTAKVKAIMRQGSTNVSGTVSTITTLPSSTGGDIGTWHEYSHTFTISDDLTPQLQIQGNTIDTYYIDDVSITYVTPFTPTYNGFVQNADFEDQAGGIAPWSLTSGTASTSFSSDSNSGTQAARIDITADLGAGNVMMGNNYALPFDSPKTVAASGDYVTITWDMKASSTDLELSWRFTLGGTADKSLFSGAKKVSVTDKYEPFSITKTLDGESGITYDDINTLSARVKVANNGDWIIIDNITTQVVIAGTTLSVNDIDYKDDASISIYPNPVQNILNINSLNGINKIEIYNILGQNVLSIDNSNSVNIQQLNKGVYITKIYQENDVISTKRFFKN